MILRTLNEFILESVVLAVEPARKCICDCSFCFATLNSKYQTAGQSKSLADTGSFERILEKAYSPGYDPTNFLQWALRNGLVLTYANTTEPFQNLRQSQSFLQICDNRNIPLFIQMKGVNFWGVADRLRAMKDNVVAFVSIPTLDQAIADRFEPGTPPIAERLKIIEWLAENDFWTIGALSPYHEQWCGDPEKLVTTLAEAGVDEIFFDRLHLNQRQLKTVVDPVIKEIAGARGRDWPDLMIGHMYDLYHTAIDNDLEFYTTSFNGTVQGCLNTLPTICPPDAFARGVWFSYNDGAIFHALEEMFYHGDDGVALDAEHRDFNDSIILRWSNALEFMEAYGAIDQPFSYKSLRDLIAIEKKLPDVYKQTYLKPKAPMSEYFRAFWNNPHIKQFFWRHPWARIAMRPDGTPWTDDQGNLIGLFDPDYLEGLGSGQRTVESLEPFREIFEVEDVEA